MRPLIPPILFLAAGTASGGAHFALARRTADLIARRRSCAAPAALTLLRMALTAATLAAAARFGPASLLAAFAGFIAVRSLALRSERRRP